MNFCKQDMVIISSSERFLGIFRQSKTSEGDTVVDEVNKAAKISGNARIMRRNPSVFSPSVSWSRTFAILPTDSYSGISSTITSLLLSCKIKVKLHYTRIFCTQFNFPYTGKVLRINRLAKRLLIVSTNLDGISLTDHGWFAKLSLYGIRKRRLEYYLL